MTGLNIMEAVKWYSNHKEENGGEDEEGEII